MLAKWIVCGKVTFPSGTAEVHRAGYLTSADPVIPDGPV